MVGSKIVIGLDCTYWTCGQCCVFHMWVVWYKIVTGLTYWTCGQCCVFHMWVVGSKIVIGLYVPDMWSVLFVPYVGDGV